MPEFTLAQAHAMVDQHLRDGRVGEAESILQMIVQQVPQDAIAASKLAQLRLQSGQVDAALGLIRQCIALQPNDAGHHCNLAMILSTAGRISEAIPEFQRATELNPKLVEAHSNLGNALRETGRYDEAVTEFRKALALKPDFSDARWNLAFVLLAHENFAEGWPAYESRLAIPDVYIHKFPQPRWDGTPLTGKTILIHAEQGMGDTFNFIRYVTPVAKTGGRVIVQVQRELHRLMQSQNLPVEQWIADGDPLPAFDVQVPLLSLPGIFGTTVESIPSQSPPIIAPAPLVASWKARLVHDHAKVKVGLVWAGNQYPVHNRKRSMTLQALSQLASVPNVSFYSLQKGSTPDPLVASHFKLKDLTGLLNDFADTAALMSSLDLIISVDTGVAHLAGAMGRPVWTLLPYVPDWRYFLNRSDSPWYPSMRLYRQKAIGDWTVPIEQVRAELQRQAAPSGS